MAALKFLERRRELVLLSCDLQRAALSSRLARIEGHRGLRWSIALLAAARLLRRAL